MASWKIIGIVLVVIAMIGGFLLFWQKEDNARVPIIPLHRVLIEEHKPDSQPMRRSMAGEVRNKEEEEQLYRLTEDDQHVKIIEELRDVIICGQNYRAKVLLLDNVDVIERIAEILNDEEVSSLCNEFLRLNPPGKEFAFFVGYLVTGGYNQETKEDIPLEAHKYIYDIQYGRVDDLDNTLTFRIDITKKQIFASSVGSIDGIVPVFPIFVK